VPDRTLLSSAALGMDWRSKHHGLARFVGCAAAQTEAQAGACFGQAAEFLGKCAGPVVNAGHPQINSLNFQLHDLSSLNMLRVHIVRQVLG